MAERIGVVDSVSDATGQSGQYKENSTGTLFDFVVIQPSVYVVPGDSVKVVVSTPNNARAINPGIVIEVGGRPT